MKTYWIILGFFQVCLAKKAVHFERLNTADIAEIENAVKQKIYSTTEKRGPDGVEVKFLIPGIIRLVFHDCIDGCDGCINLKQDGNQGLKKTVAALDEVYKGGSLKLNERISRADFWAIASRVAINCGIDVNNNEFCKNSAEPKECVMPKINLWMMLGRRDCAFSPGDQPYDNDLPDPRWNHKKMEKWWRDQFNMDANSGLALMGMHSLGRASKGSSNYEGVWEKGNQDGISNRYYSNIVDKCQNWTQINAKTLTGKANMFQWVDGNGRGGFALNADMSGLLKFEADENTGEASCEWKKCEHNKASSGMFGAYASSKTTWVNNIKHRFSLMLHNGNFLYWPPKPPKKKESHVRRHPRNFNLKPPHSDSYEDESTDEDFDESDFPQSFEQSSEEN